MASYLNYCKVEQGKKMKMNGRMGKEKARAFPYSSSYHQHLATTYLATYVVGPSHWHWQASPIRPTTLPKAASASRLLARCQGSFTVPSVLPSVLPLVPILMVHNRSMQYTYTAIRTARPQERMSA